MIAPSRHLLQPCYRGNQMSAYLQLLTSQSSAIGLETPASAIRGVTTEVQFLNQPCLSENEGVVVSQKSSHSSFCHLGNLGLAATYRILGVREFTLASALPQP